MKSLYCFKFSISLEIIIKSLFKIFNSLILTSISSISLFVTSVTIKDFNSSCNEEIIRLIEVLFSFIFKVFLLSSIRIDKFSLSLQVNQIL